MSLPALFAACLLSLLQDGAAPDWGRRLTWDAGSGPEGREHGAFLLDPQRDRAVLVGGSGYRPYGTALGDAWSFDLEQERWRELELTGDELAPAGSRRVAPVRGGAYLHGGYGQAFADLDGLWRLECGDDRIAVERVEQRRAPPARMLHGFACDEAGERFVVFGGLGGDDGLDDTWIGRRTGGVVEWEQLHGDVGPGKRFGFSFAFDPERGALLVCGGQVPPEGDVMEMIVARDLWSLDFTAEDPRWTLLAEYDGEVFPGRRNPAFAFDAGSGDLFVWGGTGDGATALPDLYTVRTREPGAPVDRAPQADGIPTRASGFGLVDPARGRALLGFGNTGAGPFEDLVEVRLRAAPARVSAAFPAAPPVAHGVDPEALRLLAEQVQRDVDDRALVGAELHVIKDRRTILHEAFGMADRDDERPMETDSVFCVRSMTKPLCGTAVQMLIDEGRLTLDTKASEILPCYDTPATADITIEHLLTHTSGLPLTSITRPLTDYASLDDVAREAAGTALLFAPGSDFQYSDAGSDTLGAIVAALTGEPVEVFLQRRLVDPLGMTDTYTLLEPGSPALARIPSAYSGGTGSWRRHWEPSGPPMFPLFLTSQGLYSTTSDYARFLALWLDGGRELLSPEAVTRGLTPRHELPGSTGFTSLTPYYGQQWVVYSDGLEGRAPTVFGHSGSDGTHAWVWPGRDLIVLLFTQSRGTLAGVGFERTIEELLIEGDLDAHRERRRGRDRSAADLAPYEGIYRDEDNARAYYVVRLDDDQLVIERPGGFTSAMIPTATRGHFSMAKEPGRVLEFEAPVDGSSAAFLFPFPDRTERQERYVVNPDLPSVESVLEELHAAHGLDAVEGLGVIRMAGVIDVGRAPPLGRIELLFDGRRLRLEATMGPSTELLWITEDDRVISQVNGAEPTELMGAERAQSMMAHPIRRVSGWREEYAGLQVLRPLVDGVHARLLVRAVSHRGTSATMLIDLETGRLADQDRIDIVPGLGEIGLQAAYRDFRDVQGVMLPFAVNSRYGHPFMPSIQVTFESVETHVDAEDRLAPPALGGG